MIHVRFGNKFLASPYGTFGVDFVLDLSFEPDLDPDVDSDVAADPSNRQDQH